MAAPWCGLMVRRSVAERKCAGSGNGGGGSSSGNGDGGEGGIRDRTGVDVVRESVWRQQMVCGWQVAGR